MDACILRSGRFCFSSFVTVGVAVQGTSRIPQLPVPPGSSGRLWEIYYMWRKRGGEPDAIGTNSKVCWHVLRWQFKLQVCILEANCRALNTHIEISLQLISEKGSPANIHSSKARNSGNRRVIRCSSPCLRTLLGNLANGNSHLEIVQRPINIINPIYPNITMI